MRRRTSKAPAPRGWAFGLVLAADYIDGHAAAEGHPLSEHSTTLSPVPLGCVDVVVPVLQVATGGITVATTVLLPPTRPVT